MFSQSLSKFMVVFKQGQLLSFAKPWHVELFGQDLERHLESFLLQRESTRE